MPWLLGSGAVGIPRVPLVQACSNCLFPCIFAVRDILGGAIYVERVPIWIVGGQEHCGGLCWITVFMEAFGLLRLERWLPEVTRALLGDSGSKCTCGGSVACQYSCCMRSSSALGCAFPGVCG